MNSQENLFKSSLYGVGRELFVQPLIYTEDDSKIGFWACAKAVDKSIKKEGIVLVNTIPSFLIDFRRFGAAQKPIFESSSVYPLEMIKIRQQCSHGTAVQIARKIFQQEGFGAFYKGLTPQLGKSVIKPI